MIFDSKMVISLKFRPRATVSEPIQDYCIEISFCLETDIQRQICIFCVEKNIKVNKCQKILIRVGTNSY